METKLGFSKSVPAPSVNDTNACLLPLAQGLEAG